MQTHEDLDIELLYVSHGSKERCSQRRTRYGQPFRFLCAGTQRNRVTQWLTQPGTPTAAAGIKMCDENDLSSRFISADYIMNIAW
jgi:hypothetical protein